MRTGGVDKTDDGIDTGESRNVASFLVQKTGKAVPRIALLTPYTGGNLGDAAIQDAMMANLRLRLPGVEFSGISLNCENFVDQHGMAAFPLCKTSIPFYGMSSGKMPTRREHGERSPRRSTQKGLNFALVKRVLKHVPVLGWCLTRIYACWKEFWHWVQGYRFLHKQDLLLVSGGGQLNEQCGGPWGQPFALFKWAVLARIAHVPYAIASVGVGQVSSKTSRLLISAALRMAQYRSYRDKNSGAFAAGLLRIASTDPIVPDLALSLPQSEIPRPAGIRAMAHGRRVVAISPIIYAKPSFWPPTWCENRALYDRYVGQMARVVSQLLKDGYFLVLVYSSLGDDESVIPEILGRLDDESREMITQQIYIPEITKWVDLVAVLLDVDFLIASRLHSAILGLVTQIPTIAISYDRKVDWMMEDLGQTDCLLQISDFAAEDVIRVLDRLNLRKHVVVEEIATFLRQTVPVSNRQYDFLAEFALAGRRRSRA